MMSRFYELHGLRLASDCPLANLRESEDGEQRADIQLIFQPQTPRPDQQYPLEWQPYLRGQTNEPGYRIAVARGHGGAFYRMSFYSDAGEATFIVNAAGDAVWIDWRTRTTDDAIPPGIRMLLSSRVWGVVLRLRGLVCLHGNLVGLESGDIALLGESGVGKSTLAAAFLKHNYPILSDDRVVLQYDGGIFWAQPGAPHLSLWRDTLAAFELDPDAYGRIINWADKRLLRLSAPRHFRATAAPLRAIYVLEPRQRDLQHLRLERLKPTRALRELMLQRFGVFELPRAQAASEYRMLLRLADAVPLYRLHRPDSFAAIPELVQLLQAETEQAQPFAPAEGN
jgi:hypothetical protein